MVCILMRQLVTFSIQGGIVAASAGIDGSATLTMKASTTHMNWAAATIVSADQRDACPLAALHDAGSCNGRTVLGLCDMALRLQCIRAALLNGRPGPFRAQARMNW